LQWHWRRTIRLTDAQGRATLGWFALRWDLEAHQVLASAAPELHAHWPQLIARLRRALDLDADTTAVEAALSEHLRITNPGVRVSGAFDGFEVAVRAILGQQVTVAAARTFARRVVERLGEPIETPWPDMSRVFPTAQTLARVEPSVLGEMGIVRQRQAAIQALALAVQNGLDLNPGCANATQREATLTALQALPGIGAWTAQYIAMRCLRHTDAWPAGDIVLHNALNLRGITSPTARAKACEAASEPLKPWRAYAVIRLWDGSATLKEPT
jgi:AraC family transcriptional regulator, regulatory protein of adaptative response / DNA-3-methyladenine glycosylase II